MLIGGWIDIITKATVQSGEDSKQYCQHHWLLLIGYSSLCLHCNWLLTFVALAFIVCCLFVVTLFVFGYYLIIFCAVCYRLLSVYHLFVL